MRAEGVDLHCSHPLEHLATLEKRTPRLNQIINQHTVPARSLPLLHFDNTFGSLPHLGADDGLVLGKHRVVPHVRPLIGEGYSEVLVLLCLEVEGLSSEHLEFTQQQRDSALKHRYHAVPEIEPLLQRMDVENQKVHGPAPARRDIGENPRQGARRCDLPFDVDPLHRAHGEKWKHNLDAVGCVLRQRAQYRHLLEDGACTVKARQEGHVTTL
mmetsp:Transcript_11558/g.22833  ORF Transcript_11558/g.22833 Transcript_11558/m.22833 type:complete len:213 (+) Transcript_11558:226-864(+)